MFKTIYFTELVYFKGAIHRIDKVVWEVMRYLIFFHQDVLPRAHFQARMLTPGFVVSRNIFPLKPEFNFNIS